MKFIIDLIEDIREQIGNNDGYILDAGLLKEDPSDESRLIYSGEAKLNTFNMDEEHRTLLFAIDGTSNTIGIGDLTPALLIADMDCMMYGIKIDVNAEYKNVEVVGFGKNEAEKRYILFIKI